jgi:hypothetical protein
MARGKSTPKKFKEGKQEENQENTHLHNQIRTISKAKKVKHLKKRPTVSINDMPNLHKHHGDFWKTVAKSNGPTDDEKTHTVTVPGFGDEVDSINMMKLMAKQRDHNIAIKEKRNIAYTLKNETRKISKQTKAKLGIQKPKSNKRDLTKLQKLNKKSKKVNSSSKKGKEEEDAANKK